MSPVELVPEAYYHIYTTTHGDREMFETDDAYRSFLAAYQQVLGTNATTFAYCLLPTHAHFFVRIHSFEKQVAVWYGDSTRPPSQFDPFSLQNDVDYLFETVTPGALKRIQVRDPANYIHLVRYIHQNPALHQPSMPFQSWRWSSYQAILKEHSRTAIDVKTVLQWFHGVEWFEEMHWEPVDETKIGYLILDD